ncbi:hypothetical protein MCEMAEM21_00064 [Oxalobacteraceae bacterium]
MCSFTSFLVHLSGQRIGQEDLGYVLMFQTWLEEQRH